MSHCYLFLAIVTTFNTPPVQLFLVTLIPNTSPPHSEFSKIIESLAVERITDSSCISDHFSAGSFFVEPELLNLLFQSTLPNLIE